MGRIIEIGAAKPPPEEEKKIIMFNMIFPCECKAIGQMQGAFEYSCTEEKEAVTAIECQECKRKYNIQVKIKITKPKETEEMEMEEKE